MNAVRTRISEKQNSDQVVPPQIRVGIYWFVMGVVIGDAVLLEEAEPYGEALQHGGHYDYWCRLRPRTKEERTLKSRPYDYWPRGRVVFFPLRIEIEEDEHYRCAGCNPGYLE